jgi:N-acetylneuraminate synthase
MLCYDKLPLKILMVCKVIAEIGINHDGVYVIAKRLVEIASSAGCWGVKFQYRNPENIYHSEASEIGDDIIRPEMEKCYLKPHLINSLTKYAHSLNMKCGISFFSTKDVNDFTREQIETFDFFKVPSVELMNKDLIEIFKDYKKLIILSVGGHSDESIDFVLDNIQYDRIVVLHCVSNYPTEIHNAQIGYIDYLKNKQSVEIGYSSHDANWEVCIAAIAKGAAFIERHITLSKYNSGLDHSSSSTHEEFRRIVLFADNQEALMSGSGGKVLNSGEMINLQNLGRSPILINSKKAGERISSNDIEWRSPLIGLNRYEFEKYSNFSLVSDVRKGQTLIKSHFINRPVWQSDIIEWANKKRISLPARLHDCDRLHKKTGIKYQELHLSCRECLEFDFADLNSFSTELTYSLHAPDYISSTCLFDPLSENSEIAEKSLHISRLCIKIASTLSNLTGRMVPIVSSFSCRTNNRENHVKRVASFCVTHSREESYMWYPQWLPPYAWYFGGSVKINSYNNLEDLEVLQNNELSYCLDLSHAIMCEAFDNIEIINLMFDKIELIQHIHLASASGIDGEGIGFANVTPKLSSYFERALNMEVIKVLEVWQGHLDDFDGFEKGLTELYNLYS